MSIINYEIKAHSIELNFLKIPLVLIHYCSIDFPLMFFEWMKVPNFRKG